MMADIVPLYISMVAIGFDSVDKRFLEVIYYNWKSALTLYFERVAVSYIHVLGVYQLYVYAIYDVRSNMYMPPSNVDAVAKARKCMYVIRGNTCFLRSSQSPAHAEWCKPCTFSATLNNLNWKSMRVYLIKVHCHVSRHAKSTAWIRGVLSASIINAHEHVYFKWT